MASSGASLIPEETPSGGEQNGTAENNSSLTNQIVVLLEEHRTGLSQVSGDLADNNKALEEIKHQYDIQNDQIQILIQQIVELNRRNEELVQQNVDLKGRIEELAIKNKNLTTEKNNIIKTWILERNQSQERLEDANRQVLKLKEDLERFQHERDKEDEPAKLACIEWGYTQEKVKMAHQKWKQENRCHATDLLELLTVMEREKQCSGTDSLRGKLAIGQIPCKPFWRTNGELNFGRDKEKKNHYEIKYPMYAEITARRGTYGQWTYAHQEPDELAPAGFFSTRYEDCVRCFSCDVALRRWDQGDDPWIEHARWSPHCTFLKETIGQQYINFVQAAFNDVDQEEEWLTGTEDNEAMTNTQVVQEEEARFREVLVCKVVEDGHHYVLLPCNHVAECAQCSQQCDCSCPGAQTPVQGAEGGIDPASE